MAGAAALIVETCAMLAVQAARRGELAAARYLLEQALSAMRVRRDENRPNEDGCGAGKGRGRNPG